MWTLTKLKPNNKKTNKKKTDPSKCLSRFPLPTKKQKQNKKKKHNGILGKQRGGRKGERISPLTAQRDA